MRVFLAAGVLSLAITGSLLVGCKSETPPAETPPASTGAAGAKTGPNAPQPLGGSSSMPGSSFGQTPPTNIPGAVPNSAPPGPK